MWFSLSIIFWYSRDVGCNFQKRSIINQKLLAFSEDITLYRWKFSLNSSPAILSRRSNPMTDSKIIYSLIAIFIFQRKLPYALYIKKPTTNNLQAAAMNQFTNLFWLVVILREKLFQILYQDFWMLIKCFGVSLKRIVGKGAGHNAPMSFPVFSLGNQQPIFQKLAKHAIVRNTGLAYKTKMVRWKKCLYVYNLA